MFLRVALLGLLLITTSGCATLTGFVFGAITHPVSAVRNGKQGHLFYAMGQPLIVPGFLYGPFVVGYMGALADIGFCKTWTYGGVVEEEERGNALFVRTALPFGSVFDPIRYLNDKGRVVEQWQKKDLPPDEPSPSP